MGPGCRGIPVLDFKNVNGLGFHGLVRRDGLGFVDWFGGMDWVLVPRNEFSYLNSKTK